jgi:hypothetical protein
VKVQYFSTKIVVTLLVALSMVLGAQAATQQEMGVVINLAGKQRMLTQKMSKEILLIASGVDVDANKGNLKETATLFDKTLKGLVNSDAELGLPKTEDAEILKQLEAVTGLWTEFHKNVEAVLGGDTSKAVLEQVGQQNLPLLKGMNDVVQLYAKSGSSLDAGVATTLDLAGKQRMLTQKMTKELLLVANGIDAAGNTENLKKTANLFERTLKGLIESDAELGLPGTKNEAILKQLAKVQQLWAEYKPILDKVDVSPEGLKKAAEANLSLFKEMNESVKMYEESIGK